jgi:hypothetical protein
MALFTIILDHAGGIYLAQVTARCAIQAIQAWAKVAPTLGIPAIGPAFSARALKDEVFIDPVPVAGTRNVWCTGISIRGYYGHVNIVATDRIPVAMGVSSLERLLSALPKRPKPNKSRQKDAGISPVTNPPQLPGASALGR